MIPTCDPYVFIEEQSLGYVRYINLDGVRWEVFGICNQCGKCWEGAVNSKPELDCPVTPKLTGCDQLTFREL